MANSVVPIQPRSLIETTISETADVGNVQLNDSAPADMVRRLMQSFSTEELLVQLSPERKALFDRLRSLRQSVDPISFDTTAAIRELREDG